MKILIYLLILTYFLGCAANRNSRVSPLYADDPYWKQYSPKELSKVIVTEGDLKRKYHPIAKIYVDSSGSDLSLSFERMKQEGANIGADAVIKIQVKKQYEGQSTNLYTGQNYGPVNRHYIEGLAVLYSVPRKTSTSRIPSNISPSKQDEKSKLLRRYINKEITREEYVELMKKL